MKHTRKHAIKRMIAVIICAAVLVTGIGSGDTVSASAAAKAEPLKTSIAMKPGDTKRLTLTDGTGKDIVENYKWSSSDNGIASVDVDFVDEYESYDMCIEVTAVSTGTATITGTCKSVGNDVTVKVTISKPKATAKQKACKHTWKTTKKATCQRVGIKTCTKCKLQKETKKTSHAYVKATVWEPENDGWYHVYECSGCDGKEEDHESKGKDAIIACDKCCFFRTTVKYDKYGNITPDSEYSSEDKAYDALFGGHQVENSDIGLVIRENHGAFTDYYEYINEHPVKKTVTKCKYCGKLK